MIKTIFTKWIGNDTSLSRRSLRHALIVLLAITVGIKIALDWREHWQQQQNLQHLGARTAEIEITHETTALDPSLFGPSTNSANVATTSQSVSLEGLLVQQDPKNSSAIIRYNGQVAKIYHIGDTLPFGAKIQAITTEGVLLRFNDHLEKLPLPRHTPEEKPQDPKL